MLDLERRESVKTIPEESLGGGELVWLQEVQGSPWPENLVIASLSDVHAPYLGSPYFKKIHLAFPP